MMITEPGVRGFCPSPAHVDHATAAHMAAHMNGAQMPGMKGQPGKLVMCAGCERPIMERFLLNVLDRAWHARCVQCADCKLHLTEKCFSREGKLYCREDFFRRFGTKCGGCSQGISPNDLVRRARNKVFHLKCFTCMVCRKQLSTGEELYVLDENKFICKEDYLASKLQGGSDHEDDGDMDTPLDKLDDMSDKDLSLSMEGDCGEDSRDSILPNPTHIPLAAQNGFTNPTQGLMSAAVPRPSPKSGSQTPTTPSVEVKQEPNNNTMNTSNNNDSADRDSNSSDCENDDIKREQLDKDGDGKQPPGAKRRGPRTTIKAKQLETLKAAFAATPKPTRHIREQLAQETGLNMRVIQVWFQNRRSKERRMKQLSALGARRHFFRNPRMRRTLRPGEVDDDMMQPGFNYPFTENGEFYPGYPDYNGYFPGQPGDPTGMNFLPPTSGPGMDGVPHPAAMGPEGAFLTHADMGLPPHNASPEPGLPPMMHPDFPHGPPRALPGFNPGLQPHQEMGEAW